MAIESGGGQASSKYAKLTQVLRSLLGELYDDSPSDLRDEATLNMARLQIIAPPSTPERERIAEATPDDLRDFYEYALLNQGGRSSQPPTVQFGGVEQNANEFWSGVEARVRDDNIDRATVQDVIDSRSAGPGGGEMEFGGGRTEGTGPSSPFGGGGQPGQATVQPASEDPARPGGLDGGSGGSGGGVGGDTWSTSDDTLPADGTARQIPGGEELWHVDGKVYLAYRNPDHPDLWMTWHVENPERLEAIYGDSIPAFDREMTRGQYEALSPWEGGLSAELQNTSEDPWTQFNSDFNKAAERRPWLKDPTMIATIAGSYLEGRDPTRDELAETDWWNDHTAEERAFMENAVTSGRSQLREQIRTEARKWLGPEFGNMSAQQLDDWTKRVHEDPSFGDDFLRLLKQQRKALFPSYEDEELTYEDITQPFRNLASNVWGQPFDDEAMLVDLANTQDYTEAAKRLRRTGLKRGVGKVVDDALGSLGQTAMGERVVRSAI